ncbi:hypothetical protein [Kordiimonas pumila]|uniref:Uncharacterized protein n=1 Tax=Kordiimonas pumila TaxID=2161677 RepID=A0ABV7D020_9PROT|nr:hypothetical protein [Kordiimonas pumila]
MAEATTIMYGSIDAKGALKVQAYTEPGAMLDNASIASLIANPPTQLEDQPQPFWCYIEGPHRLVYHLSAPNWFFPTYPELQQGRVPWRLKTLDPAGNFSRPVLMPQSEIYGGDDLRIKTIYVDDAHKDGSNMPVVFNLYVDIWNDPDDVNSWKTPIVIDPGGKEQPF